MKHKAFILMLTGVICGTTAIAQRNRSMSIAYRLSYQHFEEVKDKSQVFCILDIVGDRSHFYNRDFERAQVIADSMRNVGTMPTRYGQKEKKRG